MFTDYSLQSPTYAELASVKPTGVTAEDISMEMSVLVQRYKCDPYEITYEFEPLTVDEYTEPDDKFTLLNLKYVRRNYANGMLSERVVSERVVLVPEHISAYARKIMVASNAS